MREVFTRILAPTLDSSSEAEAATAEEVEIAAASQETLAAEGVLLLQFMSLYFGVENPWRGAQNKDELTKEEGAVAACIMLGFGEIPRRRGRAVIGG